MCTLLAKRGNEDNKGKKRKERKKEPVHNLPLNSADQFKKPPRPRRDNTDIYASISSGTPFLRKTEMIAIIPKTVHCECKSHLGTIRKLENTLAWPTTTGGFGLLSNRNITGFDAPPAIKVTRLRQESSAASPPSRQRPTT